MKSKMSYKAKRNAIVIAIIALLVILASTGIYAFIKGNSETQATSETNGTSQDRASEEIEQAQNDNNGQSNPAQENDDHESDEDSQEPTTNDEDNNIDDNEAQDNNYVPQDNNGDSQRENTQTITTIEEVETTNTVVGFETADMNVNISSVEAKLPNIESEIEAVTGNENNYVANGKEITYNIKIKNNGEALSNINVSTIIPEGTEIIEDSISDEGILENGEISWKVDIDTEKTLSFKVTVAKESGEISLNAIVNGKQTNTVTNVIDEKPVVNVIDPNRYQIEVGSEYVEKGYSAIDKEDGDITDKVVLSYRFQAMGAPTWENPDPTELDTNRLGVYKITYTVTDSRGNTVKGTRVVEIVDTMVPEIIVKEESVGTDPYYSKISFKLHDNTQVKEYEINGNKVEVIPNAWSDANYQNIKEYLVEGENTILLRDTSGNEASRTFIYDTTAPEITVKEESVGTDPYFSEVSFKLHDENQVKEYEINGNKVEVTPNAWSDANYQNIKKHLVEDKNTILLRDMAGNETIYEFYFDNTPARRSATNILVYGDKNENKEFYAKIGDTIQTYISFNEKLAHNPKFILINNGKEFEMDTSLVTAQEPNKDGKYIYQVLYKIEDNTEFVDGEITLRVTDLEDMYGNKIPDETKPTNGHKVYFDTTAPILGEGHPLYILNRDDKDNRKYIGDNEYLRVEANFNEELAEEPILTIGTGENTQVANLKSNKYSEKSGNYVYVWDIKLDNSILKLEDGTVLPFTITNVKDLAGNETSFNNDNVSYTDEYGQVIYDNAAPKYKAMGIFNWTNNKYGGDVKYASKDEHIRLFVAFPEMLAVNPKVDIYGEDGTVTTMELVYGEEAQFYYVEFDTTNELNLPQGKIEFKIYGYEDEAGNVGEELTDNDTTDKRYPEVVYDSIAPSMKVEDKVYGPDTTETIYSAKRFKAEAIDELSGIDKIYANEKERPSIDVNGESSYTFRLVDKAGNESKFNVIVDKTAPEAKVFYSNDNGNAMTNKDVTVTLKASETIKNIEGWTKVDDKTFTKIYSENGKHTIKIEDLAGNISEIIYEVKRIDKEAPVLTLNGNREIVIELGKGQYEELGAVANDNMDKVVQVPEPSKVDWYGQNGAEEFNVDKVDVNREGKYNVFYTYTDKAGNKGEIIRKVYVKDYSRVELSEPTYKKLDNGNVLVTIEANKLIEVPEGWDLSADGKSISREYSSNTDYYGEKIVVKGVNGGKDDVIVKISDFEDKDVICIDSSESLRKLASDINNGTSFVGKTIKLTSDINLSGEKWTPIYAGKGVLNNATIDGNGYTINGMNTYRDPGETNGTVETPYGNGFISDNTGTLTIKNIVFTNVSITDPTGGTDINYTQHYVGTVVGHNQGNLNIENVTVKNANIKTSWQGGGLVGYSSKNLTFDNCKIYNSYVGGFNATTGSIFGLGIIDVNINNCIASNVKLYTDSLTFDSTAKREGNFWVGSLYPQKGTVLTVTNSTEKDVVVVDSEM